MWGADTAQTPFGSGKCSLVASTASRCYYPSSNTPAVGTLLTSIVFLGKSGMASIRETQPSPSSWTLWQAIQALELPEVRRGDTLPKAVIAHLLPLLTPALPSLTVWWTPGSTQSIACTLNASFKGLPGKPNPEDDLLEDPGAPFHCSAMIPAVKRSTHFSSSSRWPSVLSRYCQSLSLWRTCIRSSDQMFCELVIFVNLIQT